MQYSLECFNSVVLNAFHIAEISNWTVTHQDTWQQYVRFCNGKGNEDIM